MTIKFTRVMLQADANDYMRKVFVLDEKLRNLKYNAPGSTRYFEIANKRDELAAQAKEWRSDRDFGDPSLLLILPPRP